MTAAEERAARLPMVRTRDHDRHGHGRVTAPLARADRQPDLHTDSFADVPREIGERCVFLGGVVIWARLREDEPVDITEQRDKLPARTKLDEGESPAALRQSHPDCPGPGLVARPPDVLGEPLANDGG